MMIVIKNTDRRPHVVTYICELPSKSYKLLSLNYTAVCQLFVQTDMTVISIQG